MSTIDAGESHCRSALAVEDEVTPTEHDTAGLVLESGSGLDPAELVADALSVVITEDRVRRAWAELKRKTSKDNEIDAVVTAARSTADRMPNSQIPPDLVQRPAWV